MKAKTRLLKKQRSAQALATKALKDVPVLKPSKGYVYLEDVEVGTVVKLPSIEVEAIKIATSAGQTTVIITEHPDKKNLGKGFWANKTEVKL